MQKYGIDDENTLEILVSDIENISDMRDKIKEYDNKLSACNERIKMLKENIGKAEKTDIEKLKALLKVGGSNGKKEQLDC